MINNVQSFEDIQWNDSRLVFLISLFLFLFSVFHSLSSLLITISTQWHRRRFTALSATILAFTQTCGPAQKVVHLKLLSSLSVIRCNDSKYTGFETAARAANSQIMTWTSTSSSSKRGNLVAGKIGVEDIMLDDVALDGAVEWASPCYVFTHTD